MVGSAVATTVWSSAARNMPRRSAPMTTNTRRRESKPVASGSTSAIVSLTVHLPLGAGPHHCRDHLAGGSLEPPSETGHGDLDDPIMPPLQEWMGHPAGQPHRRLSHHHRPRHFGTRAGALGMQPERGRPGQVPVDLGVDGACPLAPDELDAEPHAIRQGRGHHPVKYRSGVQTLSVETELGEPGPPGLELVDLLQAVPQVLGDKTELERCRSSRSRALPPGQG